MKKILVLVIMLLLLTITSCNRNSTQYSKQIYAMDTVISVTLYEDSSTVFNEISKIFEKYHQLADPYNGYTNINNVYDLNEKTVQKKDEQGYIEVSSELLELLKYAIGYSGITKGYFNPFIGKISLEWKKYLTSDIELPTNTLIDSLLKEMNDTILLINGNKVKIEGNAKLDLGGFAKGFATQKVVEYLKENKITNYIINAGNSNVAVGEKPVEEYYKVGLKKAFSIGNFKVIEVKDKAVVTSSVEHQHKVVDERIYHHIINPLTGYPEDTYTSLVIIGGESGLQDAFSTAFFNMPITEIKLLCQQYNLEVILLKMDEIVYDSTEVVKNETT